MLQLGLEELGKDFHAARVGRTVDVLIESVNPFTGVAEGRTVWDAPDVDGTVHVAEGRGLTVGAVVGVLLTGTREAYDLEGVPA